MRTVLHLATIVTALGITACGAGAGAESPSPTGAAGSASSTPATITRYHRGESCAAAMESLYLDGGYRCAAGRLTPADIRPAPKRYHAGEACTPTDAAVYKALLLRCVKVGGHRRLRAY